MASLADIAGDVPLETVASVLWSVGQPLVACLGTTGIVGFLVGLALKRVGQLVAVLLGLAVALLQGMAHVGFVTVHWDRIQDFVRATVDLNKDGRVDEQDLQHLVGGLGIATMGLPSLGGFAMGLLLGLRV